MKSAKTGFYLRVMQEGDLAAGDSVSLFPQGDAGVAVADIVALYLSEEANQQLLRRASELSALPESWREHFRQRLFEVG